MDNTIKVIIEIPRKVFEARKVGEISPWVTVPILDAVQNGVLLDDIKQKILAIDFDFGDYYNHTMEIQDKVLEVLDKEE